MPKLILSATAAALAVSAALYALAGGSEGNVIRLPVLTRPSPTAVCKPASNIHLNLPIVSEENGQVCYRVNDTFKEGGALVSVSAIKPAVQALGGTVSILPDGQVQLRMPDGTWTQGQPAFKVGGESYLLASSFLGSLIQLRPHRPGSEVFISGYRNPVLRIGGQTIQFDATSDPKIGGSLYSEVGGEVINALFYPRAEEARTVEFQYGHNASPRHRIQTGLPAGEVVTLVQRIGENEFFTASGEVQADGTVELGASSPRVRFVASPKLVTPSGGSERTSAILVRVTNVPLNNLKVGIFTPAQPTSDAN